MCHVADEQFLIVQDIAGGAHHHPHQEHPKGYRSQQNADEYIPRDTVEPQREHKRSQAHEHESGGDEDNVKRGMKEEVTPVPLPQDCNPRLELFQKAVDHFFQDYLSHK